MRTHINFLWVRHLNVCVCPRTHVDNVGKYFYDNRVEKDLSRHKIQIFGKSDCRKIKNEYLLKDIVSRMINYNREFFATHLFYK